MISGTQTAIASTSLKWRKRISRLSTENRYCCSSSCFSFHSRKPLRYAVLGAGFAGLSVAWNLLQLSFKESDVCVDIYDEVGIGGGASGVAGGLLHPYTPKAKIQWHGAECWKESLNLLNIAEAALLKESQSSSSIIRRRGILRPLISLKHKDTMIDNARHCLPDCRIVMLNAESARELFPDLYLPLNVAFYMPEALNINAESYLQGLFLACRNLANEMSKSGSVRREFRLHKQFVSSLHELSGDYDAVILCFGARTGLVSELDVQLPLRTCRGVIARMQLDDTVRREAYPKGSPSILSDTWLAMQEDGRHMDLGSTWDWKSQNYSRNVSIGEATESINKVLIPKASSVYPSITTNWNVAGSVGGLRAMPPMQAEGSLPLLGCLDELVRSRSRSCSYWVFGGLGARGLLFHAWFGKLTAMAVLGNSEGLIPLQLTSWKGKILYILP